MNNTFNLNRFKYFMVRERQNVFKMIAIKFSPILFVFLVNSLSNGFIFNQHEETKMIEPIGLLIATLLFSYGMVFPNIHSKNVNYTFVMLPMSALEKLLGMSVYAVIVTPLLVLGGYFVIDTICTALPFTEMSVYFWQAYKIANIQPYFWVLVAEYCLLCAAISAWSNLYVRNANLKILLPTAIAIILFILALFVSKLIDISVGSMLIFKDSFTIVDIFVVGTALLLYAFTYRKMKHLKY